MNDNYLGMAEGVREFLSDLGLEQYYEMFLTKGFDSESDMGNITEADLDCLGVRDIAHRQLLLTAAFHYSPSEEHRLYEWLRLHQLDYYHVNFVRSELLDMTAIMRLNLPDEGLYDELEILLPGHRRRLESAVKELRKRHRLEQPSPEEPLAVGRWGKPAALVDAKYDFLCVQAVIASTKNAGNTRKMDFMVDSGSDVVTLREEILESLELELLGTVRSKGVHASREKPLYRARLSIGNSHIEIEVMPESYDSLGSRVIRHFRHFIDGNKHVWLPGNYTEVPLPSYEVASLQEARIGGDPELPSQIGVEQESPVTEQVGEVGQASNTLESEEQSASTICPDPKAECGNESNLTASPTVQTLSRICGSTTTKTSLVEGISRAMTTMQSVSCKDCSLMLPPISCNCMSSCNPSDHTSCDVISPPNLSNCSNVLALCQCAMSDISRSGCFTNRNTDNGREESYLCQHKDHGSRCSFRCCPESQVSDVVPTEIFAKPKIPKKILSHTTVTCPSIQSTSAKDFPRPLKRISPTDDSCTPAKRTCSRPSNHEGFSTLLSSGVSGNTKKCLFRNEIDSRQNCSPFVDESGCQNYSHLLNSEKIK